MNATLTTLTAVNVLKKNFLDQRLPVQKYQDWLNAITADDAATVRATLSSASLLERRKLLAGPFYYQDLYLYRRTAALDTDRSKFLTCRPLVIAVLERAWTVLDVMLEHGADPLITEDKGRNAVHSLITLESSFQGNEDAVTIYKCFMLKMQKDKKVALLHAEEESGLRPVEYAAKLGKVLLLRAILETSAVYMTSERMYGLQTFQLIDVTEYETYERDSRHHKSPLAYLSLVDEKSFKNTEFTKFLEWQPIRMWCNAKFKANVWIFILWFLIRFAISLLFITVFMSSNYGDQQRAGKGNSTSQCDAGIIDFTEDQRLVAEAVLFAYATMALVYNVVELSVGSHSRRATPLHRYIFHMKPSAVVSAKFYRFTRLLCLVMLITCKLFTFTETYNATPAARLAWNLILFFTNLSLFVSVLHVLQMVPVFGYHIMVITRMVCELFYYILLYTLLIQPFVTFSVFYFNTSSSQGCIVDFSSYLRASYACFNIVINTMNLNYSVSSESIMYLFHMTIVFVIGILFLNFLIAMTTTTAGQLERQRRALVTVERLYLSMLAETRWGKVLARYYRSQWQQYLVVEESKVYLLNVSWN